MRFTLFILFLVFGVMSGRAQDSIMITNHYSVYYDIPCCRNVPNQLECIDSLIELSHQKKESSSTHDAQKKFFKQKKAFIIYNINAGGILWKRGNYKESQARFTIAKQYADSLKQWTKHYQDIERIMTTLVEAERNWCFRLYRIDSLAFYECDCVKHFPELTDSIVIVEESPPVDSTNQTPQLIAPKVASSELFGKFYLNDSLRFDTRFIIDKKSVGYFEKNQSYILSNLSNQTFSEILREMSTTGGKNGNQLDTLIIKVDLSKKENQLTKKCSVVYSNCRSFISDIYLNLFMNMDLQVALEPVSFYVPIVIEPIENDIYYNLDKTVIEKGHYLIQYGKLRPLKLH